MRVLSVRLPWKGWGLALLVLRDVRWCGYGDRSSWDRMEWG
ncbi:MULTISPECIES: hypothetical protein [unclassified Streptomyces]|nr:MULTISPECIES: hypothetical protein [unclassified Streptomyces]